MRKLGGCLLLLLALFTSSTGFVRPPPVLVQAPSFSAAVSSSNHLRNQDATSKSKICNAKLGGLLAAPSRLPTTATALRGGATALATFLTDRLVTSCNGGLNSLVALWAVSSVVLVPLTLYRQAYSFSVGYGFGVMAMGLALLHAFQSNLSSWTSPPAVLTLAIAAYGLRLGSFLVLRNATVESKRNQVQEFEDKAKEKPRWKRLPLALSVSLFYTFMITPVYYALRGAETTLPKAGATIQTVGAALAVVGGLMEAVADGHKYLRKKNKQSGVDAEDSTKDSTATKPSFVGPTGGFYRLSRHPNYLGEVLFWLGIYVGGAPSFGTNPLAWIASSLGLWGIVTIMQKATTRLDTKQMERYGGQVEYDEWRSSVKGGLFPKP